MRSWLKPLQDRPLSAIKPPTWKKPWSAPCWKPGEAQARFKMC
jgi:hypothetical protein